MDRYRSYYAYLEAMKMSLALYRLADELPDEEQHLLATDLRRAAVEVPTAVAQNLINAQPADLSPILKLQTVMELITKIYPALDTSSAEQEVDAMGERLADHGRFMETVPAPEPVAVAEDEPDEDVDNDDEDEDSDPEVHIGVSQEE